jgi:hypothetical protein
MRKLLLLANPGIQGVNWAPQVFNVLERYKQYFKSSVGGYWQDDEIIDYQDIDNPKAEASWVGTQLVDMTKNAEYSVIVFVGHGGAMHGDDYIQLSKGELCPVSCLTDNMGYAVKRTVVVDACRSFIGAPQQLVLEEQRTFSQGGILLGIHCRDYYNEIINNSTPHIELIQSTQYGVPAVATSHGTAFSDALFGIVGGNTPMWSQFAIHSQNRQNSKSNQDVLNLTRGSMGTYMQVPQISSSDGSYTFPFFAIRRV